MHCRPFWVSWCDYNISVGQGHKVGENSFMSYKDASPHEVYSVSLTSGYMGMEDSNGTFILRRSEGDP